MAFPDIFPFLQALSTNGDETGVTNMVGNYSATPTNFFAAPPAGTRYKVYELKILIAANGALNMIDYGQIGGGLTNGITIQFNVNGVLYSGGVKVFQNWGWAGITNINVTTFAGTRQTLEAKVNFPEEYGYHLMLDGDQGDFYQLRLNDDFSTLIGHQAWIRGTRVAASSQF